MTRLSVLFILLTVPLLGGAPFLGLPLWAWGSLAMTLAFAGAIVMLIEKKWDIIENGKSIDE